MMAICDNVASICLNGTIHKLVVVGVNSNQVEVVMGVKRSTYLLSKIASITRQALLGEMLCIIYLFQIIHST